MSPMIETTDVLFGVEGGRGVQAPDPMRIRSIKKHEANSSYHECLGRTRNDSLKPLPRQSQGMAAS